MAVKKIILDVADENATNDLGAVLATALPQGIVVGLIGPLGSGKTRLVQALARAAGVADGIVASPTFVLIHEYAGRVPIFHFDVYRVRSQDEFLALGPEEYFDQPGWSLVEWADRVRDCLPDDRLEIEIELAGATARRLTIGALGKNAARALTELKTQLAISSVEFSVIGD
jgi:tRNA threonylcarbamoyladenosine biosynthesis protein TsaE